MGGRNLLLRIMPVVDFRIRRMGSLRKLFDVRTEPEAGYFALTQLNRRANTTIEALLSWLKRWL